MIVRTAEKSLKLLVPSSLMAAIGICVGWDLPDLRDQKTNDTIEVVTPSMHDEILLRYALKSSHDSAAVLDKLLSESTK